MRPLRLTLRAFGSFPGEETIDFEALAPLGLFVVAGPTGSGKSTIFDALVFALYGGVPGRRQANEMRSDHAPEGVVPEVVLEFEASGHRYRASRSPGYERPKHRGGGCHGGAADGASRTASRRQVGAALCRHERGAGAGHRMHRPHRRPVPAGHPPAPG